MKKKKRIPNFKSEEEEAEFWDTHSPLDFEDEFREVEEPMETDFELLQKVKKRQKERKRLLTLRVNQRQIDLARKIAQWKGCAYQTQMRMWVVEGIRKELKEHPEIEKEFSKK